MIFRNIWSLIWMQYFSDTRLVTDAMAESTIRTKQQRAERTEREQTGNSEVSELTCKKEQAAGLAPHCDSDGQVSCGYKQSNSIDYCRWRTLSCLVVLYLQGSRQQFPYRIMSPTRDGILLGFRLLFPKGSGASAH